MLVGLGIYFNSFGGEVKTLPENSITLELEDGSIRVLDDTTNGQLVNTSGQIVGAQSNNKLVYQKSEKEIKQLVYNTLTIPYGKTFEISLSDGTKAYLNAGSSLKYPIQFIEGREREVFVNGEVFLDVTKSEISPFIVNADDLNIKVYGTKFNVNSYPEDNVTEVVLVEGSVGLYADNLDDHASPNMLKPNHKASFNKAIKSIKKEKVITDIYTSWMNGELVFRNMLFANILKKLERHYDVTIINNNQTLSNEKFNASFGVAPKIHEVLEELKITYNIDYSINDATITIN
ncbi:MAG: FecR family protein [Jejuia sp.]